MREDLHLKCGIAFSPSHDSLLGQVVQIVFYVRELIHYITKDASVHSQNMDYFIDSYETISSFLFLKNKVSFYFISLPF